MFLFRNEGNTTLFTAIAVSAGILAIVQQGSDQVASRVQQHKAHSQGIDRKNLNIAAMIQAEALMSFSGAAPQADNPSTFPLIFPDPYIGNKAVYGINDDILTADNWAYTNNGVSIRNSASVDIGSTQFDELVRRGRAIPLNETTKLSFLNPLMDSLHPNWIRGYRLLATTESRGRDNTNEATLTVDRLPPPKCEIENLSGKDYFDPQEPIQLALHVSGVALGAYIPETAAGAIADNYAAFKRVDISKDATSIRYIRKLVHRWELAAPRPLVAVDGSGSVPFVVTAYLQPVDDTDTNATRCSLTVTVAPPSVCKIFTSKATVLPGKCSDITVDKTRTPAGSVFSLAVEEPGGSDMSASLTKLSDTSYKFCAPVGERGETTAPSLEELGISPELAAILDAKTDGLLGDDLRALQAYLDTAQRDLTAMFPDKPALHNFSLKHLNAIAGLSASQRKNIDTLDLKSIPGLEDLPAEAEAELRQLDAHTIQQMPAYDITKSHQLIRLSDETLARLEEIPVFIGNKYVGRLVILAADPIDYVMRGTVALNGEKVTSCLAEVTAGANLCPYLGASYPNLTKEVTFRINGGAPRPYTWGPGSPNWQVDSTADSPYDTEVCPGNARCYGIAMHGNRHLFVTLQDAKSASCEPVSTDRNNLGCFEYRTKIRMADGSDQEINRIKEGDLVWNPIRKTAARVKRMTVGPEAENLVVIKIPGSTLRVTQKHPVPTRVRLKLAKDVVISDEIQDGQGKWHKIEKIRQQKPNLMVVNLALDSDSADADDHVVLADGIVSGDLFLQEKMAQTVQAQASLASPGHGQNDGDR